MLLRLDWTDRFTILLLNGFLCSSCFFELDKTISSGNKTSINGDLSRLYFAKGEELLVQILMCPFFGTVFDENLSAWFGVFHVMCDASRDTSLHAVRKNSTLGSTETWEAVFTEHKFSMFKLLELHECKVEVLEERSEKF